MASPHYPSQRQTDAGELDDLILNSSSDSQFVWHAGAGEAEVSAIYPACSATGSACYDNDSPPEMLHPSWRRPCLPTCDTVSPNSSATSPSVSKTAPHENTGSKSGPTSSSSQKWPVESYRLLAGPSRRASDPDAQSFPGSAATRKGKRMKSTFTDDQLHNIKQKWASSTAGFILANFLPRLSDQAIAHEALTHSQITPEWLLRTGHFNETLDSDTWGKFWSKTKGTSRTIIARCLRFEEGVKGPCQEPKLRKDGKISESITRRNIGKNCCAFLEIVFDVPSADSSVPECVGGQLDYPVISSLRGFLDHSESCCSCVNTSRPPTKKLHPELKAQLLQDKKDGKSRLLMESRFMSKAQYLRSGDKGIASRYRLQLVQNDLRRVRETMLKEKYGLDLTSSKPVLDLIDEILTTKSDQVLSDNVFFYQRQSEDDRFCVGLMSPSMRKLAREHCHDGICVLDGTFGLTREKMLIFFILTIDESGKSVLIGVFIFTPDMDALSASASYDASILVSFLSAWAKEAACDHHTGLNLLGPVGTIVTPLVVMTDADATEKKALREVWPLIILLTCLFHLFSAWARHVPVEITLSSTTSAQSAERRSLYNDIRPVARELALLPMSRSDQISRLMELVTVFKSKIADCLDKSHWRIPLLLGAIKYVEDYLIGYWLHPGRAEEWSAIGRDKASAALIRARPNRPLIGNLAPTTTSICENYNGWVKEIALPEIQEHGHLPRTDLFIFFFVKTVFPFLDQRRFMASEAAKEEEAHINDWAVQNKEQASLRMSIQAAGSSKERQSSEKSKSYVTHLSSFRSKDRFRDDAALRILLDGFCTEVQDSTSSSSRAAPKRIFKVQSIRGKSSIWDVTFFIAQPTRSSCKCWDFLTAERKGDWCKHLRFVANQLKTKNVPKTLQAPKDLSQHSNLQNLPLIPQFLIAETPNDSEAPDETSNDADCFNIHVLKGNANSDTNYASSVLLSDLKRFETILLNDLTPKSNSPLISSVHDQLVPSMLPTLDSISTSVPHKQSNCSAPILGDPLHTSVGQLKAKSSGRMLLKKIETESALGESFCISLQSSLNSLQNSSSGLASAIKNMCTLLHQVENDSEKEYTQFELDQLKNRLSVLQNASAAILNLGSPSSSTIADTSEKLAKSLAECRHLTVSGNLRDYNDNDRKRKASVQTQRASKRKPSSGSFA